MRWPQTVTNGCWGRKVAAFSTFSVRFQDLIEPVEFGWTNIAGFNDYSCRDMKLRPDAGRYECGTLNTIGTFGLRAAIEFLLEVGIEKIAPILRSLGDRVADGVRRRGYRLLTERTSENGAGIISFRRDGDIDSRVVVNELRKARIRARSPARLGTRLSSFLYRSSRTRPSDRGAAVAQ